VGAHAQRSLHPHASCLGRAAPHSPRVAAGSPRRASARARPRRAARRRGTPPPPARCPPPRPPPPPAVEESVRRLAQHRRAAPLARRRARPFCRSARAPVHATRRREREAPAGAPERTSSSFGVATSPAGGGRMTGAGGNGPTDAASKPPLRAVSVGKRVRLAGLVLTALTPRATSGGARADRRRRSGVSGRPPRPGTAVAPGCADRRPVCRRATRAAAAAPAARRRTWRTCTPGWCACRGAAPPTAAPADPERPQTQSTAPPPPLEIACVPTAGARAQRYPAVREAGELRCGLDLVVAQVLCSHPTAAPTPQRKPAAAPPPPGAHQGAQLGRDGLEEGRGQRRKVGYDVVRGDQRLEAGEHFHALHTVQPLGADELTRTHAHAPAASAACWTTRPGSGATSASPVLRIARARPGRGAREGRRSEAQLTPCRAVRRFDERLSVTSPRIGARYVGWMLSIWLACRLSSRSAVYA
jgi:hypothetical protein